MRILAVCSELSLQTDFLNYRAKILAADRCHNKKKGTVLQGFGMNVQRGMLEVQG